MIDLLIISGASKGIGKNILQNIKSQCKNIIAISSSGNIDEEDNLIPLKLDISEYQSTYIKLKNEVNKLSDINSVGIVLCAAQLGEAGGLLDINLKDWDKLYRCNVLGNLAVIKSCENLIKNNVKHRIAFFGGGGGVFPNKEFPGYGLTKCAIIREVETLAIEFKDYNVSIIGISPGAIDTDMLKKVVQHGGYVKTKTDISEPTTFTINFINDNLPNYDKLNGRLIHVREDLVNANFENEDLFKLRRIQ